MSERVDIRVVFPAELSDRLRKYASETYSGQKGAITLTITQALTEFLDRREGKHHRESGPVQARGARGAEQ